MSFFEEYDITSSVTFSFSDTIGSGGQGTVYRGEWDGPDGRRAVAVKIPRPPALSQGADDVARLRLSSLHEIRAWIRVTHDNVLPLLGLICNLNDGKLPATVSPLCSGGDLREYLKSKAKDTTRSTVYDFQLGAMKQAAAGVAYLHNEGILHGDLKASNILVDDNETIRICDLGVAVILAEQSAFTTTFNGTERWMAPELLSPLPDTHIKRTKATDVWAFGCVMIEVVQDQTPYTAYANSSAISMALSRYELPFTRSGTTSHRLWKIAHECWDGQPNQRPTAHAIEEKLQLLVDARALKSQAEDVMSVLTQCVSVDSGDSSKIPLDNLDITAVQSLTETAAGIEALLQVNGAYNVVKKLVDVAVKRALRPEKLRPGSRLYRQLTSCSATIARLAVCVPQDRFVPSDVKPFVRLIAGDRMGGKDLADKTIELISNPQIAELQLGKNPLDMRNALTVKDVAIIDVNGIPHIIVASDDAPIRIFKLTRKNELVSHVTLRGHKQPVNSIAASSSGRTVVSGSDDGTVRIWTSDKRPGAFESKKSIALYGNPRVTAVAIMEYRRDELIVSASGTGTGQLHVWKNAQNVGNAAVDSPVTSLAVRSGTIYASLSVGKVQRWTFSRALRPQEQFQGCCMAASKDGDFACGISNGTFRIIPAADNGCTNVGNKPILAIAFSPDGRFMATGSEHDLVRSRVGGLVDVWDTKSRTRVAGPFVGHKSAVTVVRFLPSGTSLLSGGKDGSIRIWDVTEAWKSYEV